MGGPLFIIRSRRGRCERQLVTNRQPRVQSPLSYPLSSYVKYHNSRKQTAEQTHQTLAFLSSRSYFVISDTSTFGALHCCIADSAFKQQRLPAWQPVMTAKTVIPAFFVLGVIFIPLGAVLYEASNKVRR